MDKQIFLSEVTKLSSQNLITKEELSQAFDAGQTGTPVKKSWIKEIGIAEMLYFIGGVIVFAGVGVLISQNWNLFNTTTKILSTFGIGLVAYLVGVMLNKEQKYGAVGVAFHLIAALVLPIGLGVIFNLAGYQIESVGVQSVIAGILFMTYMTSYFAFRKPFFTVFSIIYGTILFFCVTNLLISNDVLFSYYHFYEYRFLGVGLSYIFMGYYFSQTEQKDLTGALYGFGILFILTAALILGGWEPEQSLIWELLFPFIVGLTLYFSVKLKSKSFLTFGTLFLMSYILKITGEYFSGTFGWPVSLIFSGIALIGVGYYSFTLNKRYIAK